MSNHLSPNQLQLKMHDLKYKNERELEGGHGRHLPYNSGKKKLNTHKRERERDYGNEKEALEKHSSPVSEYLRLNFLKIKHQPEPKEKLKLEFYSSKAEAEGIAEKCQALIKFYLVHRCQRILVKLQIIYTCPS